MFMRITTTYSYEPTDLIESTWSISHWVIDANIHVFSPSISNNASNLKPSIAVVKLKTNAAIEANDEYLLTTTDMSITSP